MAEAIGFIGFAVTCVNTTLQIIEAVQTVRHAPQEVQDLVTELQLSQVTLQDAKRLGEQAKRADGQGKSILVDYLDKIEDIAGKAVQSFSNVVLIFLSAVQAHGRPNWKLCTQSWSAWLAVVQVGYTSRN